MFHKYINKTAILLFGTLLMITGGCKKYLDQKPITDVTEEVVFKDVNGAYKALIGVYSRLVGDAGYGIRVSLYYPLDNDEMQGPTGTADNDRRDLARYSATPGNAQINNPFSQMFQGIEFANICIENIPKMDLYTNGSDQEKKKLQRMLGEALTLRAQFYYEAIRNWGDLPAHFEPAYKLSATNPFPSRVSQDSLYDRLLADLATATALVPWKGEVTTIGDQVDERITKGAVKGLRARIALFRGGYALRQDGVVKRSSDYLTYYQIARQECLDIMNSGQHSLNPSFRSLWKDQVNARVASDPNGELMFQASAIGGSAPEDTKLGYYNGPRVNNFGNSSVNPLPTFVYLFDSTDLRRDVTICFYFTNLNGTRAGQQISNLTDGKYRRDWITNPVVSPTDAVQYFSLKWQILRYADVLLMYAEAENEINGPTASAYNAINQVRRRGFGKPINTVDVTVDIPAALSKDDFFKYLVRERALELAGEGIRKYDLIRWNLLAPALNESKANMIRMSTSTAIVNPTYMAGYPTYSLTTTLPTSLYYITTSTTDVNTFGGGLVFNSLYKTAPSTTPTGTTKITWIGAAINTTCAARFATGFVTGKGELLPIPQPVRDANYNMSQNPNY
ncbi:MAG: RagB/SusD family nutrient uptake outer membrane protein [Chitinophagaceae bacterium]|nr:RagB/SusD family nutrient uptake outer membrane protein [Chitinophagaceae bacterium]